jgi:hypothetical protein
MKRGSRPILATAALRQLSPRKTIGTSYYTPNQFHVLREPSPANSVSSDSDFRSRSGSVKRKIDEFNAISYASITSGCNEAGTPVITVTDPEPDVEQVNLGVVKVKSLMEKVDSELKNSDIPPAIACIFNDLKEAVGIVAENQATIANKVFSKQVITAPPAPQIQARRNSGNMVSLGNVAKKQRQELGPKLLPDPAGRGGQWVPAIQSGSKVLTSAVSSGSVEENKTEKFRESIRDAERSTLIFNLDMGKVPIMNKETINKKATLSLTAMAAKKEKKNTSIPSEDAVAAIDDVLSVTTGMEFFGAQTKTYRHPSDPNSGLYCTVPVKYEFENKDDKIRAETVLRDLCDIQCATPYPPLVRECIKQIISKVKQEVPNSLVRVNIDTNKMQFKISTKGKPTGTEKAVWAPYKLTVPIPETVIEGGSRRAPEGFEIKWPKPTSPRKNSQGDSPREMEVEGTVDSPAP